MNCHRWERWLALHVEGDLPESRRGALERHLRDCGACAALAEELGESQVLLKSLNGDRVPEASLTRVRREVLPRAAALRASPDWRLRLERAVMTAFRPRYAFSALAVVLVVAAAVVAGRVPGPEGDATQPSVAAVVEDTVARPVDRTPVAPRIEPPETPAAAPIVLAAANPEPAPVNVPMNTLPHVEVRAIPVADAVAPAAGDVDRPTTVVKLVTDDPNIIIYWLIDGGEGGGA